MTIHLKVITPKKLAMEREVTSITVPTATGEITVLSRHANLLSLMKEGVITIRTKDDEEYLSVGGGYFETDGITAHILVSRAYGQDEINEEKTQVAIEKARNLLQTVADRHERNEALVTMRRSLVDMKLLRKVRRRSP